MKELKRIISSISVLLVVIFCAFTLMISGCGGGDSATQTSGVTDPSTDNPYAGSSQILGQVSLSSLISTDQDAIDESSGDLSRRRGRVSRYLVDPATEAVKLYVIGEDGELEDTNIDCTCQADPDDPNNGIVYTCPNVKDEINYIVKYIKLLGNQKAIEMKANVYVGEDEPQKTANVTVQSSTIFESLKTKILDITMGTGITQEIVNTIITAVEEVIQALVESGGIAMPSLMADVKGDTIAEVFGEDIENDKLSNTSGVIASDESVSIQVDVVKTEIESEEFAALAEAETDADKEALIERVFKEMLDDGDAPDFMKDFFTDKFKAGTTKPIGDVMDAIQAGLYFDGNRPQALPDDISEAAVGAFKTELNNLYDLIEKKETTGLTDPNDLEKFAEYPPVVMGLFPIAEKSVWSVLDAETELNVPQAIALTLFVVDVYIADFYKDAADFIDFSSAGGTAVECDMEDPFDFDPLASGSIMDMLGFSEVAQNYSGIDIFELCIHPGTCWIDGNDVDVLAGDTCWMDLSAVIDRDGNSPDFSNFTVTLTYPKRDGTTGNISLKPEAELYKEDDPNDFNLWDNCWCLDPWMEANPNQSDGGEWNPPEADRIVSDFTSGTYTITVKDLNADKTYSKDFDKKVITGMTDIYPVMISPAPAPIWPGDGASDAEMDIFNAACAVYKTTNFPPNIDTGTDNIDDAAKVTVSWQAPELAADRVLPEGVVIGYALDVGWGSCDPNTCTWEHIYSTWEQDKILFGTSFTLPIAVPKKDDHPYHVNMHLVFIDQATGEHLGQGGHTHGEFKVAEPLVLTNTFTITGPVTIKNMEGSILSLNDVSNLKAALFRETYDNDSLINCWSRTVLITGDLTTNDENGIIYTLEPTIGAFLDPNVASGAWIGIDIFHDIDDDDQIDDSLNTEPWHEPQWGPQWDGSVNVWFDTWGGILRVQRETCDDTGCSHQETIITGNEVEPVGGPVFDIDIWYDPNSQVNNY